MLDVEAASAAQVWPPKTDDSIPSEQRGLHGSVLCRSSV